MRVKTLPIIRHLRWFYYWRCFEDHLEHCYLMGLGIHPSQQDMEFLDGVWEGKW